MQDKFIQTFNVVSHIDGDQSHLYEEDNSSLFNMFVIKHDCQWKTVFDLILLLLSVYNTLMNGFYAAFGEPADVYSEKYVTFMVWMDESIEFLFYVDFLLCFCQEYLDNESGVYISDII